MAKIITRHAQSLQPGDFCLGSKQVVLHVETPMPGDKTVVLHLRRLTGDGSRRVAFWGRYTRIRVRRAS